MRICLSFGHLRRGAVTIWSNYYILRDAYCVDLQNLYVSVIVHLSLEGRSKTQVCSAVLKTFFTSCACFDIFIQMEVMFAHILPLFFEVSTWAYLNEAVNSNLISLLVFVLNNLHHFTIAIPFFLHRLSNFNGNWMLRIQYVNDCFLYWHTFPWQFDALRNYACLKNVMSTLVGNETVLWVAVLFRAQPRFDIGDRSWRHGCSDQQVSPSFVPLAFWAQFHQFLAAQRVSILGVED